MTFPSLLLTRPTVVAFWLAFAPLLACSTGGEVSPDAGAGADTDADGKVSIDCEDPHYRLNAGRCQLCSDGDYRACCGFPGDAVDVNGVCIPCGDIGQPCCESFAGFCAQGLFCGAARSCVACGHEVTDAGYPPPACLPDRGWLAACELSAALIPEGDVSLEIATESRVCNSAFSFCLRFADASTGCLRTACTTPCTRDLDCKHGSFCDDSVRAYHLYTGSSTRGVCRPGARGAPRPACAHDGGSSD